MTTLDELIADSWFPFAGDITVKPLDPRVVPEPDRHGLTVDDCHSCARSDDTFVWTDERWRLTGALPTQIPGIVLLEPRQHVDSYADMPADLLAEIGPMTARVERALLGLGDVGRVHANRWGDGGAHFHLWFMPRPLGMLQLRGSMLPMWLDLLPDLDEQQARTALSRVAAAMAADGGSAHP
ncbi:MAG: hypothetical protein H0U36_12725 [Nocardioidaceae bacterium]|nr:hypothetical protein [Nocardioidaceae bacterium]